MCFVFVTQRSEERVPLSGTMYKVAVLRRTSMVEHPMMLAVPTGCFVRPGDLAAEERRREGHLCGGRTDVSNVEVVREIDESASDVVVYGIVSAPLSLSASRWRGTILDVSFQEKTDHTKRAMRLSPTNEVPIRSMVAEGTEERVLALHNNNNNHSGVIQCPLVRHQHDAARRKAKNTTTHCNGRSRRPRVSGISRLTSFHSGQF